MSGNKKKVQNVPPKKKRYQKKREGAPAPAIDKAREVAKAEGIRGKDPRVAMPKKNNLKDLVVPGSDVSIDPEVEYDIRSIQALALGIILEGYRRGWQSQSDFGLPNVYPYFAYVKLYQAFTSAMLGSVQQFQNAPKWYWYICNALQPKTLPFKTGSINYKWKVPQGEEFAVPSYDFNILGRVLRISGVDPSQPLVNGFFQVVNPPPYDASLSLQAVKSLFALFESQGMTEIVPQFDTFLIKDSSAFAVCGAEYGTSASNGGIVSTIYSARPMSSPILSKFGVYQPPAGEYQGWDRVLRSGGTPFYVLPRMVEMQYGTELRNIYPPQFLFYNFDEFFEVLALTVGKAMELAAASNVGTVTPCPLTSQQVQLLLRHTLMRRFHNHFAQDMLISETPNMLLQAFSTAANGVALTPTNMLLPLFLSENIRATNRVRLDLGKSGGFIDFFPVLARPVDLNQLANYVTSSGTQIFAAPGSEIPINLIDLSYQNGVGGYNYISTEGENIVLICETWNQWIKSLSSFLTDLTDPGIEPGIPVLTTVLTTAQQMFQQGPSTLNVTRIAGSLTKTPSKKDLGLPRMQFKRVGAEPESGSSYFGNIQISQIFSNIPLLTPSFKYLKVMVVPVALSLGTPTGAAKPAMRQVFQLQPFRAPTTGVPTQSATEGSSTALLKHEQMATLDIKSALAAESDVQTELRTLTAMGEGGLFTSLAGIFAEDVLGIKGAKAVIHTVGGALGV